MTRDAFNPMDLFHMVDDAALKRKKTPADFSAAKGVPSTSDSAAQEASANKAGQGLPSPAKEGGSKRVRDASSEGAVLEPAPPDATKSEFIKTAATENQNNDYRRCSKCLKIQDLCSPVSREDKSKPTKEYPNEEDGSAHCDNGVERPDASGEVATENCADECMHPPLQPMHIESSPIPDSWGKEIAQKTCLLPPAPPAAGLPVAQLPATPGPSNIGEQTAHVPLPSPSGEATAGAGPTSEPAVPIGHSHSQSSGELVLVLERRLSQRDVPTRTRQWGCEHCGRAFYRKSDLARHIQIHLGYRPNQCTFCGKAFLQRSALKVHIRVHTGEKPYKCQVCERLFSDSSSLARHRRIHERQQLQQGAALQVEPTLRLLPAPPVRSETGHHTRPDLIIAADSNSDLFSSPSSAASMPEPLTPDPNGEEDKNYSNAESK